MSIPGSSYENLNKFLSPFLERLPVSNIDTNSKDARAALEAIKLDEDGLVVSFDVKSLYTNVPVEEAIKIALKELYSSDKVMEIPRSAMKSLLRLTVTNVHFKFNNMWYTQSDALAMGASLFVILTNLWMTSQIREGRTKLLTQRWYALTVTDALISEEKVSSANHAKTGFMQNAKISLLTHTIWPCSTLFWSVPIVRKKLQNRTHRNWNFSRYM